MQRIGALATAAALLFCLGPGCKEDKTTYCEEKIDCEQGTQEDFDSCLASIRSEYEMAEACGCLEPYDRWIGCLNETSACEPATWHYAEDGTWEKDPDGPGLWIADDSCAELENTLHDCEDYAGSGVCGG
jgi:hypothetical protein